MYLRQYMAVCCSGPEHKTCYFTYWGKPLKQIRNNSYNFDSNTKRKLLKKKELVIFCEFWCVSNSLKWLIRAFLLNPVSVWKDDKIFVEQLPFWNVICHFWYTLNECKGQEASTYSHISILGYKRRSTVWLIELLPGRSNFLICHQDSGLDSFTRRIRD